MQHRVDVANCLPYLLLIEQVEFGRRRHRKLMTAVTQQWDGHPPEHSRGTRHEDAHVAHDKPSAKG
jgi:hypothetical protein